jgi:alpha-glucosidase
VFVKAGAIIPMDLPKSFTGEITDVLTLHIYRDISNSSFTFYQDDGISFDYQQQVFAKRLIEYKPLSNKITIHQTEGSYQVPFKTLKIVFHGFEATINSLYVNNHEVTFNHAVNQYFSGLEKYDPVNDPEPAPVEDVIATQMDYQPGEITIHWL